MFFQVLSTLFYVTGIYEEKWRKDYHYSAIEIISHNSQPYAFENVRVSFKKMRKEFEEGFDHFKPMYKHILETGTFNELSRIVAHLREKGEFMLEADLWSKILYDFYFIFRLWQRNRRRLVDIITPLYFGRTGTFCSQVKNKSWEKLEEIVKKDAETFIKNRDYLLRKYK
jgi:hypothetical protein